MSDFQYMVECTTRDIINLLIEQEDVDMQTAIDMVYTSRTYRLLTNADSGLYFQSPYYVYEVLREELKSH